MFRRLAISWDLVKASAQVLVADKELLVFPLVSAIGVLIVSITFFAPMALANVFDSILFRDSQVVGYLILFLFYVVQYTVIFFANTALAGAALIRLRGGDPTLKDGFRVASSRFVPILGYALIAATVGVILRALSDRSQGLKRFIVSLLGFGWSIATYLVVPVLAVENVGPIDAIKRSVELLRRTWGEQIAGTVGLGAVFGLVNLVTIIIGAAVTIFIAVQFQAWVLALGSALFFVVLLMLTGLVSSALSGIYSAAVYHYAVDGETSGYFDQALMEQAILAR
jgi:uncharacterized membrane protein